MYYNNALAKLVVRMQLFSILRENYCESLTGAHIKILASFTFPRSFFLKQKRCSESLHFQNIFLHFIRSCCCYALRIVRYAVLVRVAVFGFVVELH